MPTNACITYVSIKRWKASKVWKIQLSVLNLEIKRQIKYRDWRCRADQLITRATVSGTSLKSFLFWLASKTDQFSPPATEYIFLFFVCLLCNHKPLITFIFYINNNEQIYTHIHTNMLPYTHPHTHSYTLTVLPAVYYSCHLMVSSYHKSYQQYLDILLNYKKTRNLLP